MELRNELDAARPVALAELAAAAAAALRSRGGAAGDAAGAAAALCSDVRLRRVWEALNGTVRAYNNAALADREAFGAHWPAHPRRAFDLQADARQAVADAAAAERTCDADA